MSGKQIVIFISGKDPLTQAGGHSNFVRAHGRAALAAGFEPHIFGASREAGEVETAFGVLHRISARRISFRQIMLPFLAWRLTSAVTHFLAGRPGPHLIHGFSTWAALGVVVAQKLRSENIEVMPIASAYTSMRHEGWGKICGLNQSSSVRRRSLAWAEYFWIRAMIVRYERIAYQQSRLVLTNYDSVQRILRAEFGPRIPFRKICYTSESAFLATDDGANLPLPETLAELRPRDAPLLVAVSRHDLRKGLDVLLRSLARLKRAGVAFRACLVGPGDLLERHRRLAAELQLADSIVITGAVPAPRAYLAHADIFVLPSLEEGSGSVSLLEALQMGNACVVSNCDGLAEDVTHEHDALLVRPGDETALASALSRLLQDVELRRRLAEAGRQTFARRFRAETLTRELGDVYRELIDSPGETGTMV